MPQKSKTRKHADIISSLSFDDAGNLTGFENPESVTLPGFCLLYTSDAADE